MVKTPVAYYNEIDPYAAQWLRNLIAAGHIAPGDVDERDIREVCPDELRNYTQCHFFAGIGVWSYALRRAGWPDDRPVWTGSCPCQPFSVAGLAGGFNDERHLWPIFHHLIGQCRPPTVFGEQVASRDGLGWLDLVQADLEGTGYACGPVDLCAAGVGAPHIRQRLWFVAHTLDAGSQGRLSGGAYEGRQDQSEYDGCGGAALRVADDNGSGRESGGEGLAALGHGQAAESDCGAFGLADTKGIRSGFLNAANIGATNAQIHISADASNRQFDGSQRERIAAMSAGPTNGHWRDADWLGCRDGKFRPVEPGTFPLVNGASGRVGRLRAYGNCINAEAAEVVIRAAMTAL